jgi:hypothetical protein
MTTFQNQYRCDRCGHAWSDVYDGQPDDDCQVCGARKISPYDSVKLRPVSDQPKPSPVRIVIYMEGGVIQNMDIPAGCVVEVHDYDSEGAEEFHDVRTEESGDEYIFSEWEGGAP